MRKISTLLMLFCAFVGSAWAGPTDFPEITTDLNNPIYYTIYNTRSDSPGGLIYYAGDEKGIKDGCKSNTLEAKYKFYFTGTHEAMYIHNAAANGKKLASVNSWTEDGIEWAVGVSPKGTGLAFGPKGGLNSDKCWNEQNQGRDGYTTWSANDEGSIFVVNRADEWVFPSEGKFYVIECPLFEKVQGEAGKKAIYVNGEGKAVWGAEDLTNKNFYWTVSINNGKVALQNLGTGKYLKDKDGIMSEEKVEGELNSLGENNFNLLFGGTVHAAGHGSGANASGTLTGWGGVVGSASAWTFVEKADPDAVQEVTVNYNFTYGGVVKYTQSTATLVGEEYPAITVALPFGVSATKPAGTIEAGDVTDGKVSAEIVLSVNLPFVPAATYADITKWYYLKFDSDNKFYLHHDAGQDHIDLGSKAVDANNKDAYSWAFVGNPFDGYQIVNKATGEGYILSSSTTMAGTTGADTWPVMTATPVPAGNNTHWIPTASTHATNGFFLAQKDYASNRLNNRGKLAYWTGGAGSGSTFVVELRDMTGRADLQALVDEVVAANYTAGDAIGYYTQTTVDAVNVALTNANSALEGEMTEALSSEHQTAIRAAVAALVVNMPTSGAYYRLKNVYRNKYVSANASGRVPVDADNSNASLIWTLEQNGSNYTIKNLNYGNLGYMKAPGGGNELVSATDATAYTLKPFGDGQFALLKGGDNLVIYSGGSIGVWWNSEKGSDGAWIIEPATELDVTVTEAGYATLNLPFDVTLPNTVNAYAVETVEGNYASLVEKTDIPANQGAILEGAGTHTLTIATASSDWTNNKLVGTNVNTFVAGEAYVLGADGEGAGFFKAALNKNEAGETGSTHFLNNANKAYLPASAVTTLAATLRFNFGGTTAIESVVNGIDANAAIYDLSGRRVEKAVKGIYIQNGKKIIVK